MSAVIFALGKKKNWKGEKMQELRKSNWLNVEELKKIVKNLDELGYNQLADEIKESIPWEDIKPDVCHNLSKFEGIYLMNMNIDQNELIRISRKFDLFD